MSDLPIDEWTIAVELPHGTIRWVRPGVVIGLPDDGVVETVEQSRKVYEGYARCAQEQGRPVSVVVLVDRLGNQTPEVRSFWQRAMQPDVVSGCALVSGSFFARAISSFFIGLSKPTVPTKMFATLDDAIAWAEQQ